MNVVDIHQTVKLTLPVGDHEYRGQKDGCRFREGDGKEVWQKEQWRQKYTGQFLQDCLHNYGIYTWRNIDTFVQHTYEGQFFANNLEGYGVLSYPDGQIFEGLFKTNMRYGPGVLTHPNGSQDVGLWEGNNLVRLNQILPNNSIPLLAQTIQGKAYLLNYKSLVPVQDKLEDPANEILSSLEANETIMQKGDMLYSKFVRNTNSVFFNQKLYCDNYFNNDVHWTIDVVESYDVEGIPIINQVLVSHLLAWNNETLAVSFMKHAFRHRNHETILSFNVSNILTGHRYIFKDPGPQETICLEFLEACCQEDETIITKIIFESGLYPDVSDFQGNNGVIYAAVCDQTYAIKVLTNFGANVDHLNDECLTALTMSILRYTAYKYDVNQWELAFLPQTTTQEFPVEIQEWRMNNLATNKDIKEKEKYLYDLSCVHPPADKKGKKGKKDKKKKDKPKKEKKKKGKKKGDVEDAEPEILVDPKAEYLGKILNTIICLLECGARPNYGEAPFPPLILSVFARSSEIVEQLLKFGADINIRTAFHIGSLTPLHIIASLPPNPELITMAAYLLSNGADPNLPANTIHWEDERKGILAGIETIDYGKTPLQLLCMRYDFTDDTEDYLGELCTVLIKLGAEPNMYYLGHMPLTLAIIRGNIKLMQRILDSGLVDPNQGLGNNMGVPLTVLILKRYESILPLDVCKQVYSCLLDYYANPLNNVLDFEGNAIEFCLQENMVPEVVKGKKSGKSPKSTKSKKSDKSSKSNKSEKSKKGKGGKNKGHQLVIQLLYDAAENTLIRRIQRKAVQSIYQYYIECRFDDPIFDVIVKYTDVENALQNLQILLDYKKIIPCKTFCYDLLQYVSSNVKTKKPKEEKKKKGKGKTPAAPPRTIDDMVEKLDFSQSTVRKKYFTFKIHMPEVDPRESKFKVCFECFQKTRKILVLCPKCNLVYFCSQECNIKNMKKKTTKHPCNLLFYNSELQLMQERFERGEPMDGISTFDRFNSLRKRLMESPDYLEKIKQYDNIMTERRLAEKEELLKSKESSADKSGRKGKGKGKGISSRETSISGRNGKRDKSTKADGKGKSGKKGKGRDGSESCDEGGRSGKDKGGKSGKKGGKKRDDSSSDEGTSRKKKDKSKGTKDTMSSKRQTSVSPDGRKDRSVSPDRRGISTDKGRLSRNQGVPNYGADQGWGAGEGGADEGAGAGGAGAGGADEGAGRGGIGGEGRQGFFTDELRDAISDVCEVFDYKFFQMFTPYCVFVNGELYYKFDNINTFYKLTYSSV